MAEDVRVILIKLADRLHNLRTIEYLGKQKQIQKSKEALEVYAPLAHRLGIHALKWELEDLSFQTLHPRKYAEIKTMVAERRADREGHVAEAADVLRRELEKVDIPVDISGRAKHFYSIYDKMAQQGPRVQRDLRPHRDARHRRARRRGGDARLLRRARAHPLALEADAGPVQGLHRDAEVQRLPLPPHDGDRAGGPAARDPGAYPRDARDRRPRGRCALGLHARRAPLDEARRRRVERVGALAHGHPRRRGRRARVRQELPHRPLRRGGVRLHAEGRGEDAARRRDADRLRVRGPHRRRAPHRRREGQRPDRAAPLPASQRRPSRDPHGKSAARGPSRDWLSLVASSRARNRIRQFFSREQKEDLEAKGRELLEHALKHQNLPYKKLAGSAVLARRDPRVGLQEGRGLLHRARLREARRVEDRQEGPPAAQGERGRAGDRGQPRSRARARRPAARHTASTSSASTTSSSGSRAAARRCPATTSSATSRSARGSRSTAATARTSVRCGAIRNGSRRSSGREAASRASASRSRSTHGIARACSRTSRGRSPSTARTSSRTAARSRIRWRATGTRPRSAT